MRLDIKLLQDLINDYTARAGMGPIVLDEAGRCALLFDDRIAVTLETHPGRGTLVAGADLGPIAASAEAEAQAFRMMLEGNHLWRHTAGLGTLALAPAGNPGAPRRAVLQAQTPVQPLDGPAFQAWLADFVDTAEAWMDALDRIGTPAAAASAPLADQLQAHSYMLRG